MEDLERQVFKSQESTETGQEGHTDEVMLTEDSVWQCLWQCFPHCWWLLLHTAVTVCCAGVGNHESVITICVFIIDSMFKLLGRNLTGGLQISWPFPIYQGMLGRYVWSLQSLWQKYIHLYFHGNLDVQLRNTELIVFACLSSQKLLSTFFLSCHENHTSFTVVLLKTLVAINALQFFL